RGDCLFMGYLTADGIQKSLDTDGWFYTKDRGEWDDNGNLRILGRVDNMFICGGENIQPEEIEAALKQHPQIDDAIVFAIPDAQFGNLPAAIIRGSLTDDLAAKKPELDLFLADKIARFKRPRQYYVWPENNEQIGLKVNRKALIANLVKH
ncbi:MAG: AMP-binding enzyme, partial [Shewanella sp.]